MATYKTIKSYLVNLGFKVDKVSMDNMLKSIGVSDNKAIALTKTLSKAGTAVMALGTALVGTSSAALKFVNSVARSDLETERFARQMYTSYDSAKSFLAVLEQMGLSMNDIAYMTPEEYRRFNELRSFYNSVEMPDDYRETLASWRNAYTEVNKFQLLLGKFKSNIGYAILKTSGKTIDEWRAKFAKFNEYLQANMDKIAQKVAKVVDVFLRLTNALFTLGEGIVSLFDNALGKTTLLAGGVAGLIALFSTNPLMAFLGVLMLILLLIDDFKTWQRGGDSQLGAWFGDYEDFDLGEWIMTPLRKAGEWVSGKLDDIGEWLSGIGRRIDEALSGNPIYEFLKDIVGWVITGAQALANAIENSEWHKTIKKVTDKIWPDDMSFPEQVKNFVWDAPIEGIGYIANPILLQTGLMTPKEMINNGVKQFYDSSTNTYYMDISLAGSDLTPEAVGEACALKIQEQRQADSLVNTTLYSGGAQ